MHKKLRIGTYVEDCRYHPCIIVRRNFPLDDFSDSEFSALSLVNGVTNNCSVYHCGPVPLSKADAEERAHFMKERGMEAYLRRYVGFTEENIEKWREVNKIYNFE